MARGKVAVKKTAAKKSPAKKAPAKKTAAKRKGRGPAEAVAIRPIKEAFSKSALINLIAEQNELPRKTAVGVFATLESAILGSIHPKGLGEFTLPGLLKVTLRKVPARKAGTLVRNPATGLLQLSQPACVLRSVRCQSSRALRSANYSIEEMKAAAVLSLLLYFFKIQNL